MNPTSEARIRQLEIQIANEKANAVFADIEQGLTDFKTAQKASKDGSVPEKVREALYRACKGYTNSHEKAKKLHAENSKE